MEARVNSQSMRDGGYNVTNAISSSTTVEQFQDTIDHNPLFRFHHGGKSGSNVYGVTAARGSVALLKHLLLLHPEHSNLGNAFGWTPLFCLCHASREEESAMCEKASLLLEHGADPDLATTSECIDPVHGRVVAGARPIDAARKRGLTRVAALLERGTANGPR